jgi:Fe-S-cluster-containing dehydrogenase component/anaerobic selenocysteine-containing dehydrogenase
MKRRDFLKLAGLTSALAASGCVQESNQTLLPFLNPPEDIVPGIPTWYAGTCRQCPAGCGIWLKNREGRVIKAEGHPDHPINRGRLCARGQSGLADLFHPERLAAPRLRTAASANGDAVKWAEARKKLHDTALAAGGRVAVLTGLETGYDRHLLQQWLSRYGGTQLIQYEPIAYHETRRANHLVFGRDAVAALEISDCDFLLSIDTDFLETWLSPVELAAQYAKARDPHGPNARLVYAGSRLGTTGAVADRWIPLPAGQGAALAFGVLAAMLDKSPGGTLAEQSLARHYLQGRSAADFAAAAGVEPQLLAKLAEQLAHAKQPFVLAGADTDAAIAANLINYLTGAASRVMDFDQPLAYSELTPPAALDGFLQSLAAEQVQVLLVHRANPVYQWPGFAQAIDKVPFVVAIDSVATETTKAAHLELPVHSRYETWSSYEPRAGLRSLQQPAMGPVIDKAAHLAEILDAETGEPVEAFATYLARELGTSASSTSVAFRALAARGFMIDEPPVASLDEPALAAAPPATLKLTGGGGEGYDGYAPKADQGFGLVAYPSLRWYDGRDANKNWLQEIPDPLTNITWDGWVEIHPDKAKQLGVREGDVVEVTFGGATGSAPVHVYPGVHPEVVAVPMGMGRRADAAFAGDRVFNPIARLKSGEAEAAGAGFNPIALTGGPRAVTGVTVKPTGERIRLAHTDGAKTQHGRNIVRVAYEEGHEPHHGEEHGGGHELPLRIPIAKHYDPDLDMYPPHEHLDYRWGMIIDMDKCIGCSACVAACYAENNVAIVGKKQVIKGREMSWIHLERYYEEGENPGVRLLLMMCQHCNNAPCEAVCPVYAPTHNKEGINLQVYNRCVGTRYCSQNCPYKVRRFNFFKYTRPTSLDAQLNPDVTVRGLGVMEKCSFCVQRIKEAHQAAKNEDRMIRDGEVQPACVQTCPTGALTFGSYLDPSSKVYQLASTDKRAYQVLDEINTQPGVIYLKKIVRDDHLG